MRVSRRHGRIRLRLDDGELELLGILFDELAAVLDEAAADSAGTPVADRPGRAVFARLNPAAYPDDAQAEDEFRMLTRDALQTLRRERLEACRAELRGDTVRRGDLVLHDAQSGERWIQTLNDLRLTLGTRLEVTEGDMPDVDPHDPAATPWLIYDWLTATQDALVQALMRL